MLTGLAVLSLAVRVWLLERSHWLVDGDEAMVGLLAKHILDGEWPIFLPGQPYMGALQAYEAALLYQLLGMSRVALKLVPLLASIGFVLSTAWLARRLLSPRAAILAGLIAAVPPIYVAANTLRAWAPYTETMVLGNLILGLAISLGWQARRRRGEAFLLGLLAGFAFWLNPVAVYYLASAALAAIAALRRHLLSLAPALGIGCLLGSLPLWTANLAQGFPTVRYLLHGSTGARETGALAEHFLQRLLPWVLGLEQPWAATSAWLAAGLGLTLLAGMVALFLHGRRTHGWRPAPTDVPLLFTLVAATVYLLSGFGGPALNPWGFDATGRYVVPIWAAVPLGLAALGEVLWRRHPALALTLVSLVAAAHLFGYVVADPSRVFQSPYWDKLPASNADLLNYLQDHGIRHVWMNHWAGFPLMLDAREAVIAADYYDVFVGGGINRFPQHLAAVEQADRSAYVLVTDEAEPKLERRLRVLGVSFQKARAGPYVIIEPLSRRVHPGEVVEAIGYEY